jgi:hypothetical protein
MKVQLKDGRTVSFPEGTNPDIALQYIQKNFPEEPGVIERTTGHLSQGVSELAGKLANAGEYFGGMQAMRGVEKVFAETESAQAVKKFPETSLLGQVAGGITEFVPQLPLYAFGEGVAMQGLSKILHLLGYLHYLRLHQGRE